ncbi:MAG: helix-turn-helix domain-containing protein [Pseudomonadota bacterium]
MCPDIDIRPLSKLNQHGRWFTEMTHSVPHGRIFWVTRGQGRITFSGVQKSYGQFTAMYVPANYAHSYELKNPVFGWAVDISPDASIDMPANPMIMRIRDGAEQKRFAHLLDILQAECTLGAAAPDALHKSALCHHAGLITVWMQRMAAKHNEFTLQNPAQRLITRYMQHIEDRMGHGDSMSHYAHFLGVSPSQLTETCLATIGKTAVDILKERLHFEARRILITTDDPMAKISDTLGFASLAYFDRFFQEVCQNTPEQFRSAHAIKQNLRAA